MLIGVQLEFTVIFDDCPLDPRDLLLYADPHSGLLINFVLVVISVAEPVPVLLVGAVAGV